ncbi:unnamed protein product [Citrullus colocynthis]|uniref:Uncharacterized protein n=1 Tax=Citrullus colocynthis TaxID=252529 RepID=A0ABP0XPJ5_9ROSI
MWNLKETIRPFHTPHVASRSTWLANKSGPFSFWDPDLQIWRLRTLSWDRRRQFLNIYKKMEGILRVALDKLEGGNWE